jgi:hypothetical protein
MLAKAGADITLLDYRGYTWTLVFKPIFHFSIYFKLCINMKDKTAEQVSNGKALHAFYEMRGLQFEAFEVRSLLIYIFYIYCIEMCNLFILFI